MKSSLLLITGIASLGLAIPSVMDDQMGTIFARAVGDKCTAPQGSGSCQKTSNCKGISYPTGLCPKDPKDVQVRPSVGS